MAASTTRPSSYAGKAIDWPALFFMPSACGGAVAFVATRMFGLPLIEGIVVFVAIWIISFALLNIALLRGHGPCRLVIYRSSPAELRALQCKAEEVPFAEAEALHQALGEDPSACRTILATMSPLLRQRVAAAAKQTRPRQQTPLHDPIESDPDLLPMLRTAGERAEQRLSGHPLYQQFGYCHLYWRTKKQILQEEYGIEWFSPAEMSPWIDFD